MQTRKRSRVEFVAADQATRGCLLPGDLLLEIFARSDAATLIRCSASCRSLRRDILRPAFIRRVCHDGPDAIVPPHLLGFLFLGHESVKGAPMPPPPSFSLVHPATPAAASLAETHLAPSLCRDTGRLAGYRTRTSRDGLVLLSRSCWTGFRHEVTMCVYDAMTGIYKAMFFPGPPDTGTGHGNDSHLFYDKFILLTAADGIGCPFMIFSANFSGLMEGSCSVMVRTFSPLDAGVDGVAWNPVAFASHSRPPRYANKEPCGSVTVLRGGFIHWLIRGGKQDYYIFTYNVLTAESGWIEIPAEVPAECHAYGKLHLTSSPANGRRLGLLVVEKFKISVWLHSDDGVWVRQTVIDAKRNVCSEALAGNYPCWPNITVDIEGSGARSGAVILVSRPMYTWSDFEEVEKGIIVLDLETKKTRSVSKKRHTFLYEIDMAARLSAMKIF